MSYTLTIGVDYAETFPSLDEAMAALTAIADRDGWLVDWRRQIGGYGCPIYLTSGVLVCPVDDVPVDDYVIRMDT